MSPSITSLAIGSILSVTVASRAAPADSATAFTLNLAASLLSISLPAHCRANDQNDTDYDDDNADR